MESSLLTVLLLIVLISMLFMCGKEIVGNRDGGCCETSTRNPSKTRLSELQSQLDKLEEENEKIEKEISEMNS